MRTNSAMFEFMSSYISKSDIYASEAIAKISAFILKKRLDFGMSQREFALKMGVSQGMVSKWESASYNFTIENIAQICEKIGVVFNIEFSAESEYLINDQQNSYENVTDFKFGGNGYIDSAA